MEGGETVVSGPYRAISKELKDGSKIRLPQEKEKKSKDIKETSNSEADTAKGNESEADTSEDN